MDGAFVRGWQKGSTTPLRSPPRVRSGRWPSGSGGGPLWHHIGVYAYRRAALEKFVALPESPLENLEKLEQLRALEAGLRIGVARVAFAPFGVDTPADLEHVRKTLESNP